MMKRTRDLGFFRMFAAAALLASGFAVAGAAPVQAQSDVTGRLNKLEQDVQRLQRQVPGAAAPGAPSAASPTDLESRLLSLERSIELLTGQLEETRNKADRSAEQLKTMSDDVNLRLATLEQTLGLVPGAHPQGPPAASAAPSGIGPLIADTTGISGDTPLSQPMSVQRATAAPAASLPGTPLPGPAPAAGEGAVAANGGFVVRTDAAGKPMPPDPNAPPPVAAAAPTVPMPAPRAAPAGPAVTGNQLASAPPTDVKLPDASPKDQYDYAFDFLKRNDYARGEVALREFLKQHPKDALAGNAQYWLGETFYVRGNFQQAAVEFMAGYQSFPKNGKGPDNLYKLGLALEKLNQTDGACTAFGRIAKDYPDAPDRVRTDAKGERTKLKCK